MSVRAAVAAVVVDPSVRIDVASRVVVARVSAVVTGIVVTAVAVSVTADVVRLTVVLVVTSSVACVVALVVGCGVGGAVRNTNTSSLSALSLSNTSLQRAPHAAASLSPRYWTARATHAAASAKTR